MVARPSPNKAPSSSTSWPALATAGSRCRRSIRALPSTCTGSTLPMAICSRTWAATWCWGASRQLRQLAAVAAQGVQHLFVCFDHSHHGRFGAEIDSREYAGTRFAQEAFGGRLDHWQPHHNIRQRVSDARQDVPLSLFFSTEAWPFNAVHDASAVQAADAGTARPVAAGARQLQARLLGRQQKRRALRRVEVRPVRRDESPVHGVTARAGCCLAGQRPPHALTANQPAVATTQVTTVPQAMSISVRCSFQSFSVARLLRS